MSTYTEDFEAAATDANWTVAPWLVPETNEPENGGANPVPTFIFSPPLTSTPPSPVSYYLFQITEGSYSKVVITGTFDDDGEIDLDVAVLGASDSRALLRIDGEDKREATGPSEWQHWHAFLVPGEHTIEVIYDRGYGTLTADDFTGAPIDNVVVKGVTFGGVDPDPEPDTGYRRGDWLKHFGGVYIARVNGPTSEPGPGDSADWFEVSPRRDPRDLPVRASVDDPFAPGQAGLWIQLDADGNVIGQVYDDGSA